MSNNITISILMTALLMLGMSSASAAERRTEPSTRAETPRAQEQQIARRAQKINGGLNRDIIRRHKSEETAPGTDIQSQNTTGGCCLLPAIQK